MENETSKNSTLAKLQEKMLQDLKKKAELLEEENRIKESKLKETEKLRQQQNDELNNNIA